MAPLFVPSLPARTEWQLRDRGGGWLRAGALDRPQLAAGSAVGCSAPLGSGWGPELPRAGAGCWLALRLCGGWLRWTWQPLGVFRGRHWWGWGCLGRKDAEPPFSGAPLVPPPSRRLLYRRRGTADIGARVSRLAVKSLLLPSQLWALAQVSEAMIPGPSSVGSETSPQGAEGPGADALPVPSPSLRLVSRDPEPET